MKRIIFAKDANGEVKSVFDVGQGLACNCTCMSCGGELISFHKKDSWYFGHKEFNKDCTSPEVDSTVEVVRRVLSSNNKIVLPKLSYNFNGSEYTINSGYVFFYNSVEVIKISKNTTPTIVLVCADGQKLYIDIYFNKKSFNKSKLSYYKENEAQALELRLDDNLFSSYTCIEDLYSEVKNIIYSKDSTSLTWRAHPALNDILDLIEDNGYVVKSKKELKRVYCVSKDKSVDISSCENCMFKQKLTKKELNCLGTMSKQDLLKLNPDIVLPPEDINYAGSCSECGSDYTYLDGVKGDFLARECNNCGKREQLNCPMCGSPLKMHTNNDRKFNSFNSKFIGCTECAFTLTYKMSNGDFADEIKFVGGLDNLRKHKDLYADLVKYREARKKK